MLNSNAKKSKLNTNTKAYAMLDPMLNITNSKD